MASNQTPNTLQQQRWPPVADFARIPSDLQRFLEASGAEQQTLLADLRTNSEAHGRFIQDSLSFIYGYVFGYEDSPLYLRTDDVLEEKLLRAKLRIEREMLEHWLRPEPVPEGLDPEQACGYLQRLIRNNSGIYHPFFDYIRDQASRESMLEFLELETLRNEVVDDEVAFLVIGLQGAMKSTMAANLWDECGNGKLEHFHTYWLRRLLHRTGRFEGIRAYRETQAPWFCKVTSNSYNMMATRPGYKYRAYGSFLITESWVFAHFQRILAGLERVGLMDPDVAVYFDSHVRIDPRHTHEMLLAIVRQQPRLTREEIREILIGAHTAVAAGTALYERALRYFQMRDAEHVARFPSSEK
jgi:hypothetical protein